MSYYQAMPHTARLSFALSEKGPRSTVEAHSSRITELFGCRPR